MRFIVACRAFVAAMFSRRTAEQFLAVLNQRALPAPADKPKPAKPKPEQPKPPVRSDSLTVLAAMQREARFIDLVQESLDEYSDEQVGAAARDVLRDCRNVLDRMFSLRPLVDQAEGDEVQVPSGFDTGRYRLIGKVEGEPPFVGRLVHHGWMATKVAVPQWSGSEAAASVVAPAEVELPD